MRAPPVHGEVPRSRVERLRPRGFSRQEQSVVGRFEAQVKATPDAVAVVFGARSLSYRQLNARANHLAWRLRRFVTAPEPRIGICAERSLEMLIGLLAILKAGGAYVPLDPDHPRERLAFIIEDCQIPVVLTQRALTERLPKPPPARLLLDALTGEEPVNPPLRSDADSLAYVMYTSGSTGRAKGTLIPHRGVVRLVKDTDYAAFGRDEVFLQLASLSFDASTFEIWGPLLNGGCLAIMPPGPPSLGQIGEAIRQHGVTTLWLTAGLFHLMVDHAVETLRPLRQLLAGGDVLSVPHVRRALQALPGVRLINGYGPTENTTFTCCYSIPADLGPVERIPIGKAIARTEVYVLDEDLQPVPPGVVGELCVGGDGLARGYLNQPELTAERFVSVPWMSGPAARLYRTGDRACWRPDGTFDFLGRQDQQVKLRGFRIEPGEIEAALGRCPEVREAAVVVREEADGDKQLVAWVVPRNGNTPSIEALRQRLAGTLPDHMIPSAFGFIEALPLTPNGKVDRRALQERRLAVPGTPASAAIPLTTTQTALAAAWRTLLAVEEVAPGTHFFDLGGHSLLAMRLAARIRERWGVELSLPDLFAAPTLESMAARIESRLRSSPALLRDFPKVTDPTPLPSCEQERMYFLRQWCPAAALYNEPLALRWRGPIDAEALRQCLQNLEHRHEALRTTFVVVDGVLRQRINPCRELTLAVEDLSHLPPDQKEDALKAGCEREATDPFDLEAGPVWRQRLFLLGNEDHVLLLTWHHVCVDEWSIGIFLDELRTLYRSDVNARARRLPPLGACYSGYAAWQREWLRSEAAEAQLAYWRRQLAGPLPELVLPTARPQPEVPGFHGATERLVLASFSVERVRALERAGHCTEFTVLLAALFAWLHQVTGQTDLLIGTPISTRTRPETQSLVGLFLNTLPIRADLGGNPTFREVIRRVRQVAMDAYSHRDLPFDRLVEALSPARNGRPSPLVQIAFVRLGGLGSESGVGSWDASPLPVHTGTAKFDLTLFLADQPGGLTATLEYRTDLFDAAGIQGMLGGFASLLTGLLARPDTALSELDPAPDAGLPVERAGANTLVTTTAQPQDVTQPEPAVSTPTVDAGKESTLLEQRLLAIWRRVLKDDGVAAGDDFFARGGHSMQVIKLVAEVEKLVGRAVPMNSVFHAPTAAKMARLLLDEGWAPMWSSLIPLKAGAGRPPLFLLHGLRGEVFILLDLIQRLDSRQPVYGVQAVGWDGKQPRHTTTEAMAAHYVKEIRSLQPEGPYHLAGYSLGSVIAFEVAQQLAAQGQTVGLLALLDGLPQHLPWRFSFPIWLAHYGRQVVFHFRALVGRPLRERWSYFGLLLERLQSHWLLHQRGRSGKQEDLTAPQLAAAGASLGEDYFRYVVAAYHPKPYPGSALLIVPQEAPIRTEPVWRHLVRGPLAVESVPGDHRSIVRNPDHVAFLATALNRHLESTHRGTTPTNGSGTVALKC